MTKQLKARELFASCSRWVVITGAGVSTDSGIGDYRDESGEWKRHAPVMHEDFIAHAATRQRYWARSQIGFPQFARAAPNTSHYLLATMEREGKLSELITQNVDRLHQRAGTQSVIDLHGRLDQVICLSCGELSSRNAVQKWLEQHNPFLSEDSYTVAPDGDADTVREDFTQVQVPECVCGGVLKPHVVFYGDNVPRAIVAASYASVDAADGLLVVGSSLMVYSSFRFVRHAHARGIPILGINRGHTRADPLFTLKLEGACSEHLAVLLAE